RIACALTRKSNGSATPPGVQTVQLFHIEALAIDNDRSSSADVEDAKLSPLKKIFCTQLRLCLQRQRLARRHSRPNHRSVEIHVRELNLSGLEHPIQKKCLSQFLGVHQSIPDCIRHLIKPHLYLPLFFVRFESSISVRLRRDVNRTGQ